jgi:thiamine biosynthesis lipoprotein ApbE
VTVIGDRSMIADATATALMAAGSELGFPTGHRIIIWPPFLS